MFICIAAFTNRSIVLLIGLLVVNIGLGALGGVTKRTLGLLKGLAKFSIVLFILQLIFINRGEVLVNLPLGMAITTTGIEEGLILVLRLMVATLPLALMLSVTRLSDLTNVLVTKLHVPYKYAFTITTAIRFIPVFSEEKIGRAHV